jgi:hypothetical protein
MIAAAAHEAWRRQMTKSGWRHGKSWDAATRTHNALVPFTDLDQDDRWAAIEAIEAMGVERDLAAAIDYPRGPARHFVTRDMVVGLRVESTGTPGDFGEVIGWDVNTRSGRLEGIHVRWDDGAVGRYAPNEGELRIAKR